MKTLLTVMSIVLLSVISLVSQEHDASKGSYSPYTGVTHPRNVYFGDTHLHTNYSPDANVLGNEKLTVSDAYRFAKGEEVVANNGMIAKLNRPLDFLVVSDHAEYLGIIPGLVSGNPDLINSELGKKWHDMLKEGDENKIKVAYDILLGANYWRIKDKTYFKSIWEDITAKADQYNDPGKFTAFIGFEWSSMANGNNLHRVVIFKDDAKKANQIFPFSALDSEDPERLWDFLADYEKNTGGTVIALAHNGNVSNGLMFSDKDFKGKPLTPAYAKMRARWEPLYEVTQMKGDGEAHPYLSPEDGFADYETWDKGNINGTIKKEQSMLKFEYAREALKMGLQYDAKWGINPFKFGLIGSTDAHTSLATAEEDNQWGKLSNKEPSDHRATAIIVPSQTGDKSLEYMGHEQTASGYAAIWAQENTRASLFEAMQRRETYATTGPRMIVRFFGGWDYVEDDAQRPNFADIGYEKGVPMGGDLSNAPHDKSPNFIVQASKDPDGANLDRLQVVKGWLDSNGQLHEKVYDVALADGRSPGASVTSIGSTVDIDDASYTNTIGDPSLSTVWSDPNFDASQRAFYYVRVIEIPTPRWTAFDKKFFNMEMPEEAVMVTQERAYTSPIWYTP